MSRLQLKFTGLVMKQGTLNHNQEKILVDGYHTKTISAKWMELKGRGYNTTITNMLTKIKEKEKHKKKRNWKYKKMHLLEIRMLYLK